MKIILWIRMFRDEIRALVKGRFVKFKWLRQTKFRNLIVEVLQSRFWFSYEISCFQSGEFTRTCTASLMFFDDAKITNREPKPSHLPYCVMLFYFIVRIGVFFPPQQWPNVRHLTVDAIYFVTNRDPKHDLTKFSINTTENYRKRLN